MKIDNSIQNLYKFRAERAYVRYLRHMEKGATQTTARHRALRDIGIDIRKERNAVIHLEKIIQHVVAPPMEMIEQDRAKRETPYRMTMVNGQSVFPAEWCRKLNPINKLYSHDRARGAYR